MSLIQRKKRSHRAEKAFSLVEKARPFGSSKNNPISSLLSTTGNLYRCRLASGAASRRKSRHGMALILVLAGIILATSLIVSLLFLSKSGRIVSGAYAGQVQTRVLANSALNLVIGQIRDATGDTTMTKTWASQPGAIRVYGSPSSNPVPTTSDNFLEGYKLYSSSVMTITPATTLGTASGEAALTSDVEGDSNPVPTTWATKIGQYVNINQAVNGVYPIVDPAVLGLNTAGASTPNPPTSTSGVQGFSDTDTSNNYPNLAMPVEWLYQLQDGNFVPGRYQANGTVQVGGTILGTAYETPTSTNPIVARVAFWTDDETSKVNINTASEGLYWDEPRVNTQDTASTVTSLKNSAIAVGSRPVSTNTPAPSPSFTTPQYQANTGALTNAASAISDPGKEPASGFGTTCSDEFPAVGTDQGLASNQPADNEYNRFPGHPATTSLSAVLSELSPIQIFSILPRYSLNGAEAPGTAWQDGGGTTYTAGQYSYNYTGGSIMGTYSWVASDEYLANSTSLALIYNSAVSLNTDRLFSSAGEAMLQPDHQLNSSGGVATTATTSNPLTPTMVEQRKFFLTADSSAPDLNLFGCPRVSMWPVYYQYQPNPNAPNYNSNPTANGNPYCSTYDKVAAFCSTLQPSGAKAIYPYYFQRQNAYSTTQDMNLNTSLYSYLQAMTSQPVPGFGGNFGTKYAASGEIYQILTEALDYIRCTNLFDASLEPTTGSTAYWYQYYVQDPPLYHNSSEYIYSSGNEFTEGARKAIGDDFCAGGYPGYGQVVPLQYTVKGTNTMGLGRTYTVSQVALQFICTGDYNEGGLGPGNGNPNSNQSVNLTLPKVVAPNTTPLIGPGSVSPPTPSGSWQKQVQAILLVELATPMQGYPVLCPSIRCTISGASKFQVSGTASSALPNGTATLFPTDPGPLLTYNNGGSPVTYSGHVANPINAVREGYNLWGGFLWNGTGACGYGSIFPFTAVGSCPTTSTSSNTATQFADQTLVSGSGASPSEIACIPYTFISQPFTVNVSGTSSTMSVSGATLQLALSYAADGGGSLTTNGTVSGLFNTADVPYQTVNVTFPTETVPVPNLVPNNPIKWIFAQYGPSGSGAYSTTPASTFHYPQQTNPTSTPVNSVGRLAIINTQPNVTSAAQNTDNQYNVSSFVEPGDTVISEAIVDGDFRLNAGLQNVPATRFALVGNPSSATSQTLAAATSANPLQGSTQTLTTPYTSLVNFPITYTFCNSTSYKIDVSNPGVDGATSTAVRANEGSYVSGVTMPAFCQPEIPSGLSGNNTPSYTGDWDNGLAAMPDGPFANMAELGNSVAWYSQICANYVTVPYFDCPGYDVTGMQRMYSPNRQVPSPGMFGSLPTGVQEKLPWRTLRFRPQSSTAGPDFTPEYSSPSGNASIPDYLFMDLFWMPVVQPYAISEPFATGGKINMNYQILPFTYIKRQTGLYAVLKNERMLCVPCLASTTTSNVNYKADITNAASSNPSGGFGYGVPTGGAVQSNDTSAWRHTINVDATLQQFEDRFNGTNNCGQNPFNSTPTIFRSPGELCDLYLVPLNGDAPAGGTTALDITAAASMGGSGGYWSTHLLTGDNSRERPYTVIYPRLTTQSNTYRVHYWVQSLKKAKSNSASIFVDPNSTTATSSGFQSDLIRGQLRGSFLIERYLQSDDSRLGAWATNNYPTPTSNLNSYYKIRIIASTDFNPQTE
jgi:uncharacterized protein (TIGR02600 family)